MRKTACALAIVVLGLGCSKTSTPLPAGGDATLKDLYLSSEKPVAVVGKPLQLDVIERALVLWSNPGETVLTPFMGVGSEVFGAVVNGRRGIGCELKTSYYRQSVKNLAEAGKRAEQQKLGLLFSAPKDTESSSAQESTTP